MPTTRCEHCGLRVEISAARCPSCGAPNRACVPVAMAPPPKAEGGKPRRVGLTLALAAGGMVTVACLAGVAMFVLVATPEGTPSARPAAADPLAELKARGKLRVAADPEAPPFLRQTDFGWEGFEYAIMSAIAGQIGVEVEVVPTGYPALLSTVASGEADLAIGQLSPTDASSRIAWSPSYLQYSLCLVTRAGGPVRARADLAGRTVGRWDDPVSQAVLTTAAPGATPKVYTDYGYFDDLAAGRIDAMLYDCPLARYEMKAYGPRLRVLESTLSVSSYAVAMRAGDTALRERVDTILRDLGNQGLLTSLAQRWLEEAPPDETARVTGRVVVARAGERFADVAARVGVAPAALHDANRDVLGAEPENLYAGMVLRVPAS